MPVSSGLILISRRAEYRAAVAEAGDVVTAAATIGPVALSPVEAAGYLRRHLPPRPGAAWTAVLADLTGGTAPEWRLTASPFGLWLVRTVYVDARRDPGELRRADVPHGGGTAPARRQPAHPGRRREPPAGARRWLRLRTTAGTGALGR